MLALVVDGCSAAMHACFVVDGCSAEIHVRFVVDACSAAIHGCVVVAQQQCMFVLCLVVGCFQSFHLTSFVLLHVQGGSQIQWPVCRHRSNGTTFLDWF